MTAADVTPRAPGRAPSRSGGGGFSGAVAAEWTKLWSLRAPYVCLLAGTAVTAVFTFYYGSIARINDEPLQPVGNAPVSSVVLVQFAVVVLAMTAVTSEYATGSVRTSLLWVPVRHRVQLAKSLVTAAVSFAAGVLWGVLGVAVAWTPFGGHATFAIAEVAPHLLAMGLYCALTAVLTVGTAFALRHAAAVLSVLAFLLAALPNMLTGLGGPVLLTVNDHLPQTAGGYFMHGGGPYAAPVGLLIVLAWTAAAHLAGRAVLGRRDA